MIVKSLEQLDEANRLSSLGFLLQAGLVSSKELREGLYPAFCQIPLEMCLSFKLHSKWYHLQWKKARTRFC
jgi:hypothetical protein